MKKYNKPNIDVIKIAPSVSIAAGLENWVMGNELISEANLTTYEYTSTDSEN